MSEEPLSGVLRDIAERYDDEGEHSFVVDACRKAAAVIESLWAFEFNPYCRCCNANKDRMKAGALGTLVEYGCSCPSCAAVVLAERSMDGVSE